MSGFNAMSKLPSLLAKFDSLRDELAAEVNRVKAEWDGLGRVGGQRNVDADCYLRFVQHPLARIEDFARACQEQIEATIADPCSDPHSN